MMTGVGHPNPKGEIFVMARVKHKQYGFFDPANENSMVEMNYMQRISGFPIGIVYIDEVNYPMVPGNVNNGFTYKYPVLLRPILNLEPERLFANDPTIGQDVIDVAREMVQKDGIRALSSGCGFFGNYQQEVADALDIPVGLSPMVMVPWIETLIKSSQKIGVLTANSEAFNENIFRQCKVQDPSRLIVRGLRYEPHFSAIPQQRGYFDNNGVCREVVGKAMEILEENENVGAILLECSDMPPYANAIQMATQLPVFDFITLINFLANSVMQPVYKGWI